MDGKQSLKKQPLKGVTLRCYDRKNQRPQRFGRDEGCCAYVPSKCGLFSAIFPPLGLPQLPASAVTTSNYVLQCFSTLASSQLNLPWFLSLPSLSLCLDSPLVSKGMQTYPFSSTHGTPSPQVLRWVPPSAFYF